MKMCAYSLSRIMQFYVIENDENCESERYYYAMDIVSLL